MPRLIVEKGNDKGKSVAIPVMGAILVGRDSTAGLQLRDTMTSRLHFKVEARQDGCWVTDLESMNGTLLNGAPLHEARKLKFGDLVRIGETLISFASDDAVVDAMEGQRVGGYRIIERVGRGGMGTVYRAEQIDLQRMVALKVISAELTTNKEFIDLFIHEARAAARLNHPNIVQVYDVKRQGDIYYFSMEFVSGGSVQELLNRQRKLPAERAVQIILDAARGLEYAHRKGIMHRDIKPDNLMLGETGITKIGDMGLARRPGEKVGPEEENSVIGTPHYIPPELVLGKPADFRSDIYSLGSTLYRMLAGVTPYNAASVRDLVSKKVREDARPLHEADPEIPRTVSDAVARMMTRDPAKREQDMTAVASSLDRILRERPGTASEVRAQDAPASRRDRWIMAGATAALLVAVVGIVATWIAFSGKEGAPVDPAAVSGANSGERARQSLEIWELRELKSMDRSDPRSVQKVVDGYQSVIDEFPDTPEATKAAERRAELQALTTDLAARRKLELLELEDVANFTRFSQAFSEGRVDWAPIDATCSVYDTFAETKEFAGSKAATEAADRAAHIRRWKTGVEKHRGAFEQLKEGVRALAEGGKFQTAAAMIGDFQARVRDDAPACGFAPDRYASLLYHVPAEAEAESLTKLAKDRWTEIDRAARLLARQRDFEGAVRLLDPVLAGFPEQIVGLARKLKKELEVQWAEATQHEMDAQETVRAGKVRRSRAAFELAAEEIRPLCAKYDFKGALQRIKAVLDDELTDDWRARTLRRVDGLERCARLKENMIGVINARDASGGNPYGFRMEFRSGQLDGVIQSADDTGFRVTLVDGGAYDHAWTQFKPSALYDFIKSQWKYNEKQNRDPQDQCDIAAFCLEFGLYEQARAEIDGVMKNKAYPTAPDAVRRFCEESKQGESAESDEVEARRRLDRVEGFLEARHYAAAQEEIDLLKSRYSRTRVYSENQETIEKYTKRIQTEGSEGERKSLREGALRRLTDHVAKMQSAARQTQSEVIRRLGGLSEPFERNVRMGMTYAAGAEFEKAAARYSEARRHGDALPGGGEDNVRPLGFVYSELYRIHLLLKDRKKAETVKADAARRFLQQEGSVWGVLAQAVDVWAERVPEQLQRLARLREEVEASPDDPRVIWDLASCYSEGLYNLFEARGYYDYLLDHHPDFEEVRSGECLYRLAEILYAAHDLREAERCYVELRRQYPDHSQVRGDSAHGVVTRIKECLRLQRRLGFKERPR